MNTDADEGRQLPQDERAPTDKIKVFVSYSRQDGDFVGRLVEALSAQGDIHVFRDTDDILPTEEWKKRLENLITQADTIVFCLSPHSAASEVCAWEVEFAENLNKRIAPIVIEQVENAQTPEGLAKLNYIFFKNPNDFGRSLEQLVQAIHTDIEWIREHTRFGELSRRWERSGKPLDQLMRGADLSAAEAWAVRRSQNAPALTQITLEFVQASRKSETATEKRRRQVQALVVTLLLAIIAGLVGLIGWLNQDHLKETWLWARYMRGQALTLEREKALEAGNNFLECSRTANKDSQNGVYANYSKYCPEMVVVPAGKFMMGSPRGQGAPNEGPQHEVTIAQSFAVSKFEVTAEQWQACSNYGGGCTPGRGTGKQPATHISWPDAQHYVMWLSRMTGKTYRLLSEAEWEYAARANTKTTYWWGDEVKLDGKAMANCFDCGSRWDNKSSAPVGSFEPNAFGLYDVHGNVWEWVRDHWHESYRDAPEDGRARKAGSDAGRRALRGGSWLYRREGLRSAKRFAYVLDERLGDIGFRVARTLEP